MGKINGCLKCLFIFFNMLFAVLGCVLIYGAVSLTSYSRQLSVISGSSVGWSWVFAIGVLCISCLGIYAGFSEKELALKIFAGFMGVGMLIMLIFGIIVVVSRNKLRSGFDEGSSEVATAIMANEDLRTLLEAMQTGGCCGVVSASDWGNNIPQSCKCRPGQTAFGGLSASTCRSKPQGAAGPDRIFAQSCGDIIFMWFDFFFKFAMGLFFGFAVTALLGLLISLLMIHQIRRHDGAGGASIAMKGY